MHKATFHTSYGDILFFPSWVLHGRKETYLSCLLVVIMGILYQGIKFARQQYGRKCRNITCRRYILNKGHFLQTALYVLQFVWGYILMLAVMTYNAWILVASLIGFGLGYFFFGWGEYEERSSMLRVFKCGPSRSFDANACGDGPPKKVSQELMPLSGSSDGLLDTDLEVRENFRCKCDEKRV